MNIKRKFWIYKYAPRLVVDLYASLRSRGMFSEARLIYSYFAETRSAPGEMIDVGAHYGESFIPYLAAGWAVHAFEPDPRNRHRIEAQIKHPGLHVYPDGISNREADGVPFFASEQSSGISSLSSFTNGHYEITRISITTLRRVMQRERIQAVDFLKVDAEGHDYFVLQGFPWEKATPEIILCEFEDRKTLPLGYTYDDLGKYLTTLGYRVYLSEWSPITVYGARHKWRSVRPFPCAVTSPAAWGNFIAVWPFGSRAAQLEKLLDIGLP